MTSTFSNTKITVTFPGERSVGGNEIMYEALIQELSKIKTPAFFVREPIVDWGEIMGDSAFRSSVPADYLIFLLEVGSVKLFRELDGYILGVYPFYYHFRIDDETLAYNFGHSDSRALWFKRMEDSGFSPVVYFKTEGGFRELYPSFSIWFQSDFERIRRRYTKSAWHKILVGPKPFSARELRVVEARRKFRWKVLRPTEKNMVAFLVENNSDTTIPFISIGINHKHGVFSGGVWLDVSGVRPGSSAIVEKDCYSSIAKFDDLEFFDLPEPEPHNRDRYWEFR
jgi:hypothetical protein